MQLFVHKNIGKNKYTFTVEGKNLFECLMESQKLSFYDVHKCGLCNSDELRLSAYTAGKKDEFDYTVVKCDSCKATLTFGAKKEDKDIVFLRKNDAGKFDWKPYVAPNAA